MSQVESGHVVTLTAIQVRVLEAARNLMGRGIRPTGATVAHALGVGGTAVRSHLATLRKFRLLPRRSGLAPPAAVEAEVVIVVPAPAPDPPSAAANGRQRDKSAAYTGPAARRAAAAEQAALRERFEDAARAYEAVRLRAADIPATWRIAHDRLLAILIAYTRLRGAEPCVCDAVAYHPNPSGDGFVRDTRPLVRHGIYWKQ